MSLFIANKPMLMHRGTTTKDFKEAIRVPMAEISMGEIFRFISQWEAKNNDIDYAHIYHISNIFEDEQN